MSDGSAKVAVVTGAGGGIGRATAARLVADGWSVVVNDVSKDALAWAEGEERVWPCPADIATEEGNADVVGCAVQQFGGLDGLVLNAAIDVGGRLEELPIETFDRLVAVNLRGVVLGLKAAVPVMRQRGGGSIVLTSSLHGLRGDAGVWAYAATKHGVVGLARALSRELGPDGFRVNAFCPGPTRSTGLSGPLEINQPERYHEVEQAVPLGRWGEVWEMAGGIAFLLGPDAGFINGATIVADGGAAAGSGLHFPQHP